MTSDLALVEDCRDFVEAHRARVYTNRRYEYVVGWAARIPPHLKATPLY
jgi:hypothetical protein